ncbi:MAG TPA: VCBS repeat-containing protein [Urbifossiella sp.]|nr:VCBS repeat-containing protein [Urbifossiella sp.]
MDGDGIPDTIFATGPGTPFRVAVVSGADNATLLVPPFAPFEPGFTAGGFVAAGDFDHDGRAEFVVTPDQGGGPRVSVYSLPAGGTLTRVANFFAFEPDFLGGARAAVGDVNGDGTPDLVLAAGFGGGPRVAVLDGTTLLATPGRLIPDFFVFDPNLRDGAYVTAGDFDGDGKADLVFGSGDGGSPRVLIVSGARLLADGPEAAIGTPLASFFVGGDETDRGGVRVAVIDADGDKTPDLAAASGVGQPGRVRVYHNPQFTGGEPTDFQDLDPFATTLPGGAFVG